MSETTPTNGQAPQTPANPATPLTIADGSVVRARIDGRDIDVPAADARRFIQMGRAAEVRLQEANAFLSANRADLDSIQRIASVARSMGIDPVLLKTNPDEALRQLAARQKPQGDVGSSSQTSQGDDADPNTTALRNAIGELSSKLNQMGSQVTSLTNSQQKAALEQQIDSVLSGYPLFQSNPVTNRLAKKQVVATWMADPQRSLAEVAGEVHAEFGEMETAKVNQERDARALAEQRNRGIPAGQGQPGMSTPPGPTFEKGDVGKGRVRAWMKEQVGKTFGSVK